MKFAQCPADVSQLEMVRQCRDQRAKLRAEGLKLTRALVEAAASPPAKVSAALSLHGSMLYRDVQLCLVCVSRILQFLMHVVEYCQPSSQRANNHRRAFFTQLFAFCRRGCSLRTPSLSVSPREKTDRGRTFTISAP